MSSAAKNMKLPLVVLIALLLTACTGTSDEKIRVGVLTPLSGDLAFLGENIARSAELAVRDMGLEGEVELVVEDAGAVGGGAGAVSAYRKLVDQDGVTVIIGGMASDGTLAVAPLLEEDGIIMITPLTGGENIDTASAYLFRNGPSDIRAGKQPAEDLNEAGVTHVALITDNAAYTLDIAKHFRASYEGEIVIDEIITPGQTDYRTTVTKVLAAHPDAIVINTADGVSSNYLFKQLHEVGNDAPLYVNFLAFNGNTLSVASVGAVEGTYIYLPAFNEGAQTQALFAAYKEAYGVDSPIPFHTTGTYDAVRMAVEAQRAVGTDGAAVQAYLLENVQGWQGMNGVVSFDAEGNAQTGFMQKRISDGQIS